MTTKRPRPKTETKPTAGARKARQTAAPDKPEHPPPADLPTTCPECGGPVEPWITDALRAVRCLSCPQFIIIENNAPVRRFNGLLDEETMRHQHARHAAAQRDAWEAEADALRTALNAGAADTMLARAKLAIEGYPSGLWRMDWTRPECRDLAAVQSAKRNLDGLLALAALTCCEIARKAGSDPAPFGIGAATLRKVYEDGLLPAADGDWPACMEPGEIDRLPETTGADLLALRAALERLNAGEGGAKAGADVAAVLAEVKALRKEFPQAGEIVQTARERDEAEQRRGDVLRDNLVLSPGAMPPGPIGAALRALDPDTLQIVNLRLTRNAHGKRLSFAEVAEQFRRDGKPRKTYTGERCRQIYKVAMDSHPELSAYVGSLTDRRPVKLHNDTRTDGEEIEAMTTNTEIDADDLGEESRKFRVTAHPRRPLNLQNSRR